MSFSIDYFNTKVTGIIDALPETAIFGDTAAYASKFVRCSQLPPSQRAVIDACVPGPVDPLAYILTLTDNLGDIKSSGLDFAVNARSDATAYGRFSFSLNGTYLTKWEQQLVKNGEFYDALGNYSVDLNFPVPRWQHVIQIGWDSGPWSANLFNRFKSGYYDFNLGTLDDDIYGKNSVGNWSVYDLSLTWKGVKGLTLTCSTGTRRSATRVRRSRAVMTRESPIRSAACSICRRATSSSSASPARSEKARGLPAGLFNLCAEKSSVAPGRRRPCPGRQPAAPDYGPPTCASTAAPGRRRRRCP